MLNNYQALLVCIAFTRPFDGYLSTRPPSRVRLSTCMHFFDTTVKYYSILIFIFILSITTNGNLDNDFTIGNNSSIVFFFDPRSDYPRSDYPRSDYPRTDYPRSDYPRSDYPRFDYPCSIIWSDSALAYRRCKYF